MTARIWPCVELQYEWLGGIRRPRVDAPVATLAQGRAEAPERVAAAR